MLIISHESFENSDAWEGAMIYKNNRLARQFDIAYPFICAGMAFICEKPDLCAAVSMAGGMGAIPVRPLDAFVTVPETKGDFDQMPILSGQGVGLI
jgi:NAD(P)H-dependent flavin oxidoreductase YrpB (nitropropane dioxygenase family)